MEGTCKKCKKKFKNLGAHQRYCKSISPKESKKKDKAETVKILDAISEDPVKNIPKDLQISSELSDYVELVDTTLDLSAGLSGYVELKDTLPQELPQDGLLEDDLVNTQDISKVVPEPKIEANTMVSEQPGKTEWTLSEMVKEAKNIDKPEILKSEVKEIKATPKEELSKETKKSLHKPMSRKAAWGILIVAIILLLAVIYELHTKYKVI